MNVVNATELYDEKWFKYGQNHEFTFVYFTTIKTIR